MWGNSIRNEYTGMKGGKPENRIYTWAGQGRGAGERGGAAGIRGCMGRGRDEGGRRVRERESRTELPRVMIDGDPAMEDDCMIRETEGEGLGKGKGKYGAGQEG